MTGKKPLIAVLMAVYKPRLDWLEEQLRSLNSQTWPNLKLYIQDDCSGAETFEEISKLTARCIDRMPYELRCNDKNLGSNRTFELLTQEAEADYFAYCDQDDIWLSEKLDRCVQILQKNREVELVFSDMQIIDRNGERIADSITELRKKHHFREGKNLAKDLLFSNFVSGCTMMLRAETAKSAIPFCPYMVHDHYLALYCANRGELRKIPGKLIKYRVHGDNQTADMAGVYDKDTYMKVRILSALERLRWLEKNFVCDDELKEQIRQGIVWTEARKDYMMHGRMAKTVWKYREFSPFVTLFELAADHLPQPVFMLGIELKRRNIL